MLRSEVGRQRDFCGVVFLFVARRPNARVVRRGEIDVNEKRSLIVLETFGRSTGGVGRPAPNCVFLLNQANGGVGKLAADVGRQAEAFFGKLLGSVNLKTSVGLKLPAAVAGGGAASKIDVIFGDGTAAAVEPVALGVADL